MRSPALAIAWEFRQRHRWGLMALTGYLLVLAAIRLLVLGPGQTVEFEDDQSFAFAVIVPLASTFMYFLAVFSFGLSGDLAARQSIYPARMFTLPVTTAALAGWPMLYGAIAMAILWLATRFLAPWPSGVDVPLIWPVLLGPALLAWTQSLTWMPYPLPGLRVIVTVLWLTVIDAVVMVALELRASEAVMLAILAPQVPLAYLVARFAVARARRGEVPDWRRVFAWLGRVADLLSWRRGNFRSAERAQLWFEWRQHGRSLPWLVAILLPFELSMLFVFSETPVIVFEVLCVVLLTPSFMAAFVAATVSRSSAGSDAHGVTPLIATRPLTNASLIAAKLKATTASALVTWMLVLAAVPIALRLSGTAHVVIDAARRTDEIFGTPRFVVIVLLGLAALIGSTWKQLVQSLYIRMSGREWAVKASVFVPLSLLAVIFPLGLWIVENKAAMAVLWSGLPWILAVLVCLKLFAAGWVAVRLCDGRFLSERTIVTGAASWSVIVFALYGLLLWVVPGLLIRSYAVGLVAILMTPLARLSAAPLALAWNRHR